ncbi:unnamed protein product [Rotaria socialis]|uniref:Uncharacterized protein n=1 Tax=Rotaria socialis TaxID=392032 RepID=A0A817V843_9BILA|nr:unnamed protein product [Rotaria socialis]
MKRVYYSTANGLLLYLASVDQLRDFSSHKKQFQVKPDPKFFKKVKSSQVKHSRAACPTISIAERMVQQKYRRMIGSTKIQSNNLLKNKVGRAIHPTVTISEPLGAVYEMV